MASFIANLVRSSLSGDERLDAYFSLLEKVTAASPPAFATRQFGQQYRSGAINKPWFASLLLNDADMEGYSAHQLWQYSTLTPDLELKEGLKKHARDEARHAGMFGALLLNILPSMDTPEIRQRLRSLRPKLADPALSPPTKSHFDMDSLVNTAVLINLHEVKALVLEKLLHPLALAHSAAAARPRTDAILNTLTKDEVEHIRYSALFMVRMMNSGYRSYIDSAMSEFLDAVNDVTWDEMDIKQDAPRDTSEAFALFNPVSDLLITPEPVGA